MINSKGKSVLADMNIIIPGSVGFFLIKNGAVTEQQLFQALDIQKKSKELLGTILVNEGFCTEADVARAIEMKTGCKFVSIEETGINFAVANIIPTDLIARKGVLPLYELPQIVQTVQKELLW